MYEDVPNLNLERVLGMGEEKFLRRFFLCCLLSVVSVPLIYDYFTVLVLESEYRGRATEIVAREFAPNNSFRGEDLKVCFLLKKQNDLYGLQSLVARLYPFYYAFGDDKVPQSLVSLHEDILEHKFRVGGEALSEAVIEITRSSQFPDCGERGIKRIDIFIDLSTHYWDHANLLIEKELFGYFFRQAQIRDTRLDFQTLIRDGVTREEYDFILEVMERYKLSIEELGLPSVLHEQFTDKL